MKKQIFLLFVFSIFCYSLQVYSFMGIASTGQPTYTFTLQKVQSLLHQEDIFTAAGFLYYTQTSTAFNNNHKKKNMGSLLFNSSAFTPAQTGAVPASLFSNSFIMPRVKYREVGGVITVWGKKYKTNRSVVGARLDIPLKKVTLTNKLCGKYYQLARAARVIQQNVDELLLQPEAPTSSGRVARAHQRVGASDMSTYAYRLDLLSELPYSFDPALSSYLITNYHDTSFQPTAPITIYNQDVTDGDNNPVSALNQTVGTLPSQPYALSFSDTQKLPILGPNGQSSLGERSKFIQAVNYTPLGTNSTAQEELWIVPTYIPDLTPKDLAALQACDISLESISRSGLGNMVTDLFTGYHVSDQLYAEAIVGVSWPTGKKRDPLSVLQPVLGNNGHYEMRLESQGIYECSNWFAVRGDLSYSWALGRREYIAARFRDATVNNIGPSVPAHISWNYAHAELDCIITLEKLHSYLYAGYGFYGKQRTHLSFCSPLFTNCTGELKELDASSLTKNTKARGHTLHAAFLCDHDFLELSVSGELTVAGKNIPRNGLGSIGLTFYF